MEDIAQTAKARIEQISEKFREGEAVVIRRKGYLSAYFETPFETDQIFLKNYESPPADPLSYEQFSDSLDLKLLPEKDFNIGCVGSLAYLKRGRNNLIFSEGEEEAESKVLPDTIPATADKMELLNGALRNSFQKIAVLDSKQFSDPISRLSVIPGGFGLHRKTVITFEKDCICTFLDEVRDGLGANQKGGFATDVIEARLMEGADVNFVSLFSGNSQIAVNYRFVLFEGSKLRFAGWTGGNPYVRSRIEVTLQGDGAEADVFTGNFVDKGGRHDMFSKVEHFGRNSIGLVIQNGVVKKASRLLLKGMMAIRKPAKGSDSHLKQHALLLSSDSFANAIPGLEIETNELKAKHAASVSRPEEEQLFYLMSRGLNEKQAITTIAFGNLGPLLGNIVDENIRNEVAEEITQTLLE